MPMVFAIILSNKLAASLNYYRIVPLPGLEWPVRLMAFSRASLDRVFLHTPSCRESGQQNLGLYQGSKEETSRSLTRHLVLIPCLCRSVRECTASEATPHFALSN